MPQPEESPDEQHSGRREDGGRAEESEVEVPAWERDAPDKVEDATMIIEDQERTKGWIWEGRGRRGGRESSERREAG